MPDELARLQEALGGRYAIQRELGRGGMATVYLANDLKHHRPVALKVLKPELAAALGPERFLREIDVTAKLNHPHILPLLDSGDAAGFLYYAMPYVEGESLRDRLVREKQLPIDDALRIAGEVADALGFAHQHNVMHRDVKPENILLEAKHAVVADFGVARAIEQAGETRLTETGVVVGTPAYLSPEQASGQHTLDGRSDIYALGCVLYEMLSGEPPFTGPTVESIIHQHLTVEPLAVASGRPTIPGDVAAAVAKALAKVPADRHQTAEAFGEAIAAARVRLITPGGGTARKEAEPIRRVPIRRRRVGIALGAAAVVVAALGTVVLLTRRSGATLDPNRVLVVAFADQTGSTELQGLGRMAQDYIIQVLTDAGFADVVDPLTALAVTQNVSSAGAGDAVALAVEAHAGTVVSGSYYVEGDSIHIQTRIADARDGHVLSSARPVASSLDARRELVAHLGREVVAALAPLLSREVGSFEPAAQPATYEAYEAYREGLEAYLGDASFGHAARDFERAVAADSAFHTARLWAALALEVAFAPGAEDEMGAAAEAKAESLLAPLIESPGRLSRYERCRLDFVRAVGGHGDASTPYDAARCMAQAAPGSDDAKRELTLWTLWTGRPREAIRLFGELDPDRGLLRHFWAVWLYLGLAHHWLGDHKQELAVARQGRRQHPASFDMLYVEARALAALGRLDDVAAGFRAMHSLQSRWLGGALADIGQELRAHGHRDAARAAYDDAVAWYQSRPQDSEALRAEAARVLYQGEHWDDARQRYQDLAEQYPQKSEYLAALGRLAARSGDRAGALSISERLRSVPPTDSWGAVTGVFPRFPTTATVERARIAALLGDRDRAMTLLQQAADQGGMLMGVFWFSLHRDMDFESLRDYPPFQELMRPKG